MAAIGTTYSFKDLSGAFTSPVAGAFIFSGEIGQGRVVVANTTEHGLMDTAPDGTVMPVYVAGDAGTVTIECQQTSPIHHFLLNWFNITNTLAKGGDVSNWATAAILLRNLVDGASHTGTGVSPQKVGDKTYTTNGTNVVWALLCANLINL